MSIIVSRRVSFLDPKKVKNAEDCQTGGCTKFLWVGNSIEIAMNIQT